MTQQRNVRPVSLFGEEHRQLSLPIPGLIERPPTGTAIPREDRVYANRNLRFGTIEWIGFDMDYTLAIYRQEAMDALSVRLTAERLIQRGYPEFLEHLDFDTRFPIRGLLIDKRRGNILKMDRHKVVNKGYHGTQLIPPERIDELYQHKKLRPHTPRYHWIDTLFALCEVTSYAALVTALEERNHAFDPQKLFVDVRAAIDQAHAEGAVYQHVTADLPLYLERDPELPRTLHKLRSAGKRLFLLTNSPYHYTDTVMRYLLEAEDAPYKSWGQYFDVAICTAKKPRWFAEGTPFMERDPQSAATDPATLPAQGTLEKGKIYEGGSLREFEKRLKMSGARVLYVGDHIYGDILRSKKDTTWKTAFVIQELDRELEALETTTLDRARRRQLAEARPFFEDELRFYISKYKEIGRMKLPTGNKRLAQDRAREQIERLRTELTKLEEEYELLNARIDEAFHPYWGSLLKEMNGLSIFGQQVNLYADIYMRRVTNLGGYSPTQFFRSPHDLMPHEIERQNVALPPSDLFPVSRF